MFIYFLFVFGSVCFSTYWCIRRFQKYFHVRKPLHEATLINIIIIVSGLIWWTITQKEGRFIIPGIIYYLFALIIIYLINMLTLSILKDKQLMK